MPMQSAEREQSPASPRLPDKAVIRKGLLEAGIPESRIEIDQAGCMGHAFDVGPVSLTPLAVVGVKGHADVEKANVLIRKLYYLSRRYSSAVGKRG